jgi:hypothetical protein
MSWFETKRDEFMNWFRSSGKSVMDFLDESAETIQEWINYKPKENPDYIARTEKKAQQPVTIQSQEQATKVPRVTQQHHKKPQLELVKPEQPIVQRGLFNKIEIKVEKPSEKQINREWDR